MFTRSKLTAPSIILNVPVASPRIQAAGSATVTLTVLRSASILNRIAAARAAPDSKAISANATPSIISARVKTPRISLADFFNWQIPFSLFTRSAEAAARDCNADNSVDDSESEIDAGRNHCARRGEVADHQIVNRPHPPGGRQRERPLLHPGRLKIDRPPAPANGSHRHDHD